MSSAHSRLTEQCALLPLWSGGQ